MSSKSTKETNESHLELTYEYELCTSKTKMLAVQISWQNYVQARPLLLRHLLGLLNIHTKKRL